MEETGRGAKGPLSGEGGSGRAEGGGGAGTVGKEGDTPGGEADEVVAVGGEEVERWEFGLEAGGEVCGGGSGGGGRFGSEGS